jgi:hypothetical protein
MNSIFIHVAKGITNHSRESAEMKQRRAPQFKRKPPLLTGTNYRFGPIAAS